MSGWMEVMGVWGMGYKGIGLVGLEGGGNACIDM